MVAARAQDKKQTLVNPAFVELMGRELLANGHKGDWREWKPEPLEVVGELHHHVGKLIYALSRGNRAEVSEYAADVANICMMVEADFGGA